MADTLYRKFVRRWEEVTEVPPQTLGILTPFYKKLAARLKDHPWLAFAGVAAATVLGLYLLLGSAIVIVTSILQRGI